MVTFRLYASARAAAGTGQVSVRSGPTSAVIAALTAQLPPRFATVLAASSLMSEGRRLDAAGNELLPDSAVVDVLPPFAGG